MKQEEALEVARGLLGSVAPLLEEVTGKTPGLRVIFAVEVAVDDSNPVIASATAPPTDTPSYLLLLSELITSRCKRIKDASGTDGLTAKSPIIQA